MDTWITNVCEYLCIHGELIWNFRQLATPYLFASVGVVIIQASIGVHSHVIRGNRITSAGWVEAGGAVLNVFAGEVIPILPIRQGIQLVLKVIFVGISRLLRKVISEALKP